MTQEQKNALKVAVDALCSAECPSTKRTGDEWTHTTVCTDARAALAATPPPEAEGVTPAPPEPATPETCAWTPDFGEWGDPDSWDTACGRKWLFSEDGPIENRMDYCMGCGQRVKVMPMPTREDEDA